MSTGWHTYVHHSKIWKFLSIKIFRYVTLLNLFNVMLYTYYIITICYICITCSVLMCIHLMYIVYNYLLLLPLAIYTSLHPHQLNQANRSHFNIYYFMKIFEEFWKRPAFSKNPADVCPPRLKLDTIFVCCKKLRLLK
jgi:hypothetical protein